LYGELVTKLKSKILSPRKLWEILQRNILILFILILICSIGVLNSLESLHSNNNQISSGENIISATKLNLEGISRSQSNNNDTNWIDYGLWLNECARIGNSYVYSTTSSLKLLSLMSQDELDKISMSLESISKETSYSNLVKFIVIDKSKNTFLTNDISNIELIKNNLKAFSEESGELYKYISGKGKWYNLTYTSEAAPAYGIYQGPKVDNPNNFVEAYWFPNDYKYTVEDEAILKDILNKVKANYQNTIDSNNAIIVNAKNNLTKSKISIVIYFILIILMLVTLYSLGKERILSGINQSFVVKLKQTLNHWFGSRSTFFKITIFILSTSSVLFIPILLILNYNLSGVLLLLCSLWILFYLIAILPKIIKFSKYIDEITKGIDKITSGDLEHFIEEKGDKSLSLLAHNINKLNKGFKVSIEDQIKNEKLKSELVANVSHDLKTPLTSIINYTDILLRENISEEEKKEYLNILNSKSLKLKNLIEDLFEISKINSGKVELNRSNVDVIELVGQSIAEYSDSEVYNNKNLTFIFKPHAKKIEMNLDGKKMSRVFENLINNALKYSLDNTRVFVEIEEIKKGIKISFKNISSAALDFHKEEIFERFTRGDTSRNSNIDGSGLGLAIAKSIVELHDGRMYIDFDGDMFKVMIEL
jgi:signal transduction histidine kinase